MFHPSVYLVVSSVCLSILTVFATEIDNRLVGDPHVECGDTMVSLTFMTEKPFTGRVYVKGLNDNDRCSRGFATNEDSNRFSLVLQNGDCAMTRQRVTGQLEGLMFSMTIVVSFHGTFVTKVDRAYRCMCFFQNIKRVTNLLDMSAIGTTPLLDTAKMPTCSYTIRSGSNDGPLMRYAKVGDKIFHVWQCDDDAQGFLVHSCWVNDGRGSRFDLMDIDGCAVDPIIQADVQYDASLTRAWVETHGYKFSDTSVLNYQCVLELCKKVVGECDGLAPPNCGRAKRSIIDGGNDVTDRLQLDVVVEMEVLDTLNEELDDLELPASDNADKLLRSLNGQYSPFHPRSGKRPSKAQKKCLLDLSYPAVSMVIALTAILFLVSVVTSAMLCVRIRHDKA